MTLLRKGLCALVALSVWLNEDILDRLQANERRCCWKAKSNHSQQCARKFGKQFDFDERRRLVEKLQRCSIDDCSGKCLRSLRKALEYICCKTYHVKEAQDWLNKRMNLPEGASMPANIESDVRRNLRQSLEPEVRDDLRAELKPEVEAQLREELIESVKDELIEEHQDNVQAKLRKKLMKKLQKEELDSFRDELKEELKEQEADELREEVKIELEAELRDELKNEIADENSDELWQELKDEFKIDHFDELREEAEQEVKAEEGEDLRKELRSELLCHVKEQFTLELQERCECEQCQELQNSVRTELKGNSNEQPQDESATDVSESLKEQISTEISRQLGQELGDIRDTVRRHTVGNVYQRGEESPQQSEVQTNTTTVATHIEDPPAQYVRPVTRSLAVGKSIIPDPKPISFEDFNKGLFTQDRIRALLEEKARKVLSSKTKDDYGFVYAYHQLPHETHIKIGHTIYEVKQYLRQKESECHVRHGTFKVVFSVWTIHPHRVEKMVQRELYALQRRVQNCLCGVRHREFFETTCEVVEEAVQRWKKWVQTSPYESREMDSGRWDWSLKADEISLRTVLDELTPKLILKATKSNPDLSDLVADQQETPAQQQTPSESTTTVTPILLQPSTPTPAPPAPPTSPPALSPSPSPSPPALTPSPPSTAATTPLSHLDSRSPFTPPGAWPADTPLTSPLSSKAGFNFQIKDSNADANADAEIVDKYPDQFSLEERLRAAKDGKKKEERPGPSVIPTASGRVEMSLGEGREMVEFQAGTRAGVS